MKLQIEQLKKSFGSKEVLSGVTYTFESGKIYGLLGKNGAGKTTFFNCLNQDITADSGIILLEKDGQKRAVGPDDIGYVLSVPVVPDFLTGREFLKFFLEINPQPDGGRTIDEYLDQIAIAPEDRDKLMKDYSHGMKSKVQMLVNMLADPNILLLDEPLTSLDVVAAEEMKELLRSMKKERITVFSTHLMDLAVDLCDCIVLLHHGVVEEVDKANMGSGEFKEMILAALREERND